MKLRNLALSTFLAILVASPALSQETKKTRLFILSGQSNMAGLKPETTFAPAIKKAFPDDDNIIVKSAQGGQPIRQWVKSWKAPEGSKVSDTANGKLYDVLMAAVKNGIGSKKIDTVSFVWMQGERDARENLEAVYEKSLGALLGQLQADLGRKDITVVIGRLSDCSKSSSWNAVRAAQVSFAEKTPRAGWVDTDDLNGADNNLHYNKEGYDELGRRFAAKTIELLKK